MPPVVTVAGESAVRRPVAGARLNCDTTPLKLLDTTYTEPPSDDTATASGPDPVASVAGESAVKRPVPARLNCDTVSSPLFATYTEVPSDDTAIPWGWLPAPIVAGESA